MELKLYPRLHTEAVGEYAYQSLWKNIIYANVQPGECISPIEVADLMQISRTPIQSAFMRLAADGLLDVYPQRGSYVSKINIKRVQESVFVRNLLDQSAVKFLCRQGASARGLMELESNVHQQIFYFERKDVYEVFDLDLKFHDMIYELCGMEYVRMACLSISADSHRVRVLKLHARMRWQQTVEEHMAIVSAIREQDDERAARVSHEHVSRMTWDCESIHEMHPTYFENWNDYPPPPIDYTADAYYNYAPGGTTHK